MNENCKQSSESSGLEDWARWQSCSQMARELLLTLFSDTRATVDGLETAGWTLFCLQVGD